MAWGGGGLGSIRQREALTAAFPPFLRLTILIKCRRNQQARTAERSAIRREYGRSNAEIFLVEECAERSHPHGSVSRVTPVTSSVRVMISWSQTMQRCPI